MGLNSAILGTLNKYTGWQHTQKKLWFISAWTQKVNVSEVSGIGYGGVSFGSFGCEFCCGTSRGGRGLISYMSNNSIHINVRTQKWHSTVRIWSVLFTWHGWLIYFVCPKLHNNPLNICCLKTKTLKPHGGSSAGQITPLRMDVSHFECLYNSILKELCLALSCNNLTILVDSLHSDDMFCAGPMYL